MTAPEPAEIAVPRLTAVLHDLLTHPQPGVAAWVRARDRAARELRDALNAVLAERLTPLRPLDDGSQPSSHHPGPFMTSMRTDRTPPVRQYMGRVPTGTWASWCTCRDPATGRQTYVTGSSEEDCRRAGLDHRAAQAATQTPPTGSLGEGEPVGGTITTPGGSR